MKKKMEKAKMLQKTLLIDTDLVEFIDVDQHKASQV